VTLVHRAWIAGLATSLLLGLAPTDADPAEGPDHGDSSSSAFAGSVVLERGRGRIESFALVGQAWGMAYRDDRVDVAQGIAALGVRRWLPGVWVQAGVGAAAGQASDDARPSLGWIETPTVLPAGMLGVGTQVGVAEIALHAGTGVDRDGAMRVWHASIGLGVRW
jgi:hypothetical protein